MHQVIQSEIVDIKGFDTWCHAAHGILISSVYMLDTCWYLRIDTWNPVTGTLYLLIFINT